MEQMEIIWLALMAVLLIIEIMTLGLTTIWFAAGALFAFLTALLGLNQGIQIGVFVVVSVVLLFFTRPWAVKYLNTRTVKTNNGQQEARMIPSFSEQVTLSLLLVLKA